MTTLDFIESFEQKPTDCTVSKIPATIRALLNHSQASMSKVEIKIPMPYRIFKEDVKKFPTFHNFVNNYRYDSHARRYDLWEKTHAILVPFIVTSITYSKDDIANAIEQYKLYDYNVRIQRLLSEAHKAEDKAYNLKSKYNARQRWLELKEKIAQALGYEVDIESNQTHIENGEWVNIMRGSAQYGRWLNQNYKKADRCYNAIRNLINEFPKVKACFKWDMDDINNWKMPSLVEIR